MFPVPLATSASLVGKNEFWKSLLIYHNRPHIVNRRIAVADQILLYKVSFKDNKILDISSVLTVHSLAYEVQRLGRIDSETINQDFLLNMLNCENVELLEENVENFHTSSCGVYLSVRLILPRMQKCSKSIELVVLDMEEDMATFFSVSIEKDKLNPLPLFPYRIELTRENFLRITLNSFEDADTACAEWLCDSLFKKLIGWTEFKDETTIHGSLREIPLQKYCEYYNQLKEKYGEPLRKIWWEKTRTDPQKFIYEDIAIASYLICLWSLKYDTHSMSSIQFVDCGCGNGLLVYILNKEGFQGYGLDLRRRTIWDLFSDADLRVGTINPTSRFPNATWLIGNHSDELTPWLPVIATKSSPLTNFFVLPCCPFDFNGKKYIRQNTSISQYADYMDYVKGISAKCGFETSVDKLRIPSTKRTCIIGVRKTNSNNNSYICGGIDDFLKSKLDAKDFKARSATEKVRNCTQIDHKIREKLVTDVVSYLLKIVNPIVKEDGAEWNKGGAIHLGKLSGLLSSNDLNHLRKECGGLQTLLKNHRYLFQIEDACVSLRMPYKMEETSKYKEKPCWYFRFHPDGCLYSNQICGYAHIK